MKGFTSRRRAEAVACPRCAATAETPCVQVNGDLRVRFHADRHAAAIAAGAGAPELGAGALEAGQAKAQRAHRSGQRGQGTNPRAAGTNPRAQAAVEGIDPPDAADHEDATALASLLRAQVPALTADAWLADLAAVGVHNGVLVLSPCPANAGYVASRYSRLLEACAAAVGVPARFANHDEAAALHTRPAS